MDSSRIAFIGAGNIARALVAGLVANNYPPEKICVSNPTQEKLHFFRQQFAVQVSQDNIQAVKDVDVIVLAVKPQQVKAVCHEIHDAIQGALPLIISVAAGVSIELLEKWFNQSIPIVRAMPNIAATVSASATGLYSNNETGVVQKNLAETIFRAVGLALWLTKEEQINLVTAASGSGPAYFFLVMEMIQKVIEEMGMPTELAKLLVTQTAQGAARMALESNHDVEYLRHQVTSPRGTTEQAITVLEEGNIRDLFARAIKAAYQRAKDVTDLLEQQ